MSPKETESSQTQREGAVKNTEPSAVQKSLHSQSPGSEGDLWSPAVSHRRGCGRVHGGQEAGGPWLGCGSILKMHGLRSRKRAGAESMLGART